ncbi:Zn(II)2Cys6 transcription factor domain-containing protein [Aspergillus melleus]|uniref:Zn(II)2Cys6 transcription factor domain-containing protein n=1 Tax=Aspergillus melleus TaxID=138277 RepID=UPI001E8D190F|nr:uncharacterized protein LDX57_010029 [Aspergillus melleus]KAH8432390.1 hypothetical protein LDX57_010029 [Aspergillus melleus]
MCLRVLVELNTNCLRWVGDEGKPTCQNCIDKNLVCQYGLQVSFLAKNTYTVSAKELRTPKKDASYGKIQFVNEDPLACTSDASTDESPSPVLSPTTDVTVPQSEAPLGLKGNDGDTHDGHARRSSEINGDIIFDSSQDLPSPVHIPGGQFQSVATFSDRDESAVRGLLALGSSNNVNDVATVREATPGLSEFDPNMILSPLPSPYTEGKEGTGSMRFPSINAPNNDNAVMAVLPPPIDYLSIPESDRLDLLRHYRYHVAPWLDICDMRQPFGLTGLQLAMGSEKLLSALMRLSKACMVQSVPERSFLADFTESIADMSMLGDSTEATLLYVLEEVRCLVTDVPRAWTRNGYPDAIQSLVQYAYGDDINSALYWLTLRLSK